MRALLAGVTSAFLVIGGAQAGCPTARTVYQVVDTGNRLYGAEVTRPDLIGAKFTVARQASQYRTAEEGFSEPTRIARRTLLLKGAKERIVVEQRFASHSSPSVTATSWSPSDAGKKTDWRARNRAQEERVFGPFSTIDVLEGPLSALQMKPVACR